MKLDAFTKITLAATLEILFLNGGGVVRAQQSAQELAIASVLPSTAEGDWVRTDPVGSGRWDSLTDSFPRAVLTPAGSALAAAGGRGRGGPAGAPGADGIPHAAGVPYVTNPRTCRFAGGQAVLEYDSEGFHMIMGKDEAVFMQERGGSRRVYLDGRVLQDSSVRAPSSSGFSVGHVEADGTLVVETIDLTPGTVTAGGYRTPETKVVQRYIPSKDGKHLTLRFEWTDPKIYQKPHVYEYFFDRMASAAYALETYCDATDPLWGQSIVPPEQQ